MTSNGVRVGKEKSKKVKERREEEWREGGKQYHLHAEGRERGKEGGREGGRKEGE